MPKFLIAILLVFFLAGPAWAQEESAAPEAETEAPEAETEAPEAAEADDEEEVDDSDLDEQTYEEDDDDFIPTEEIPADEPIPFPSNI